jgi:hypothetical protein
MDGMMEKIIAHELGVKDAAAHFTTICDRAINAFAVPEQQFAYITGYVMELVRLARQQDQENKK